jgi:hypothetical protein
MKHQPRQRRTTQSRRALAALAAAASFTVVAAARADNVINLFDSASEVSQWRYAFGGANHVESFSTDDAGGSATSGSMDMQLTFDGGGTNQGFAYTRDAFFPATDLSGYASLDFDVKVVGGSALDAFGNNGYFDMWVNNTDAYTFVHQFGDNVKTADGWRHVSVPLTAPVDQARGLTFQLYGGGAQNINGTVDLRLDNVALRSAAVPGVERAGHHFSFEPPTEVDPAHPGGSENSAFVWGDSYQSNVTTVDHTQSTLHATDGSHSMRLSQPLNSYTVSTQVLYNNSAKFNNLTSGTKLLFDVTTPGHGPGYQTIDAQLNFGGAGGNYHYLTAYNGNSYQFVDTNPGGANTRTAARTQTYTWDFGGQMQAVFGQYWPDLNGYNILHLATGNGGAASGDPNPDGTSEYFLDNVRIVNEDVLTRPTWQTAAASADWSSAGNWANGVPNAVGAQAIFYGLGAGTGTTSQNAGVAVNSAVTVGSIVFDAQMTSFQYAGASGAITSANQLPQIVNYTVSGTGSLTFSSGTGASATTEIYAIAGAHTIAVPVNVNNNLEIDTSAGFGADTNPGLPGGGRFSHVDTTSLAFSGPMTLASGVSVTTHGPGTVSFGAINGTSGGLIIFGGTGNLNGNVNVGSISVAASARMNVTANGSTVVRSGSVDLGGTIDLNNNKMIIDYSGASPDSAVRAAIISGRNNGAWNGPGLTSTSAQTALNGHSTSLGYAEASTALGVNGGSFAGQSVDGSAVLVRYTLSGDADLSGTVDLTDFTFLAANFNASVPASSASAGGVGAAVPEPGTLGVAAIAAGLVAHRRRRPRPA